MNKKSIPGWTITINEVSNGVFRVTLTNTDGHKVEITDTAIDEVIERAVSDAFEIEKQISKNWNLFLYDLAIQELRYIDIKTSQYTDNEFGSWLIERRHKRLVYEGRDSELTFQTNLGGYWESEPKTTKDNLGYSNFVEQINKLANRYKYSLKKVEKYCPYDVTVRFEKVSDIFEYTIDFSHYHPKTKECIKPECIRSGRCIKPERCIKLERHVNILENKFPNFNSHKGNLFFIITNYLDYVHSDNNMSLLSDHILYEEFKRMHFLQELLESDDNKLKNYEITIANINDSPLASDFIIKSDPTLNRLLIKSILKSYKIYFKNNMDFRYYNSSLPTLINRKRNISAKGLREIKDELKIDYSLLNKLKRNQEKEIVEILYEYIINETDLGPKDNEQIPGGIAILIYSLLLIFNAIDKPQPDNKRSQYIINTYKHNKNKHYK